MELMVEMLRYPRLLAKWNRLFVDGEEALIKGGDQGQS
jgi:hypothetical protein